MNAGDVYWVDFPARGRRAQAGRRPAIILQGAKATARLPTVLCIPLTTQMDSLRFPGTVLLESDPNNGLPRASIALTFQLTAIDRRFISSRLGSMSATTLALIWNAFDEITERVGPNN